LSQQDFAILYCYNYYRKCITNPAIFAGIGSQIFLFLAVKNLQP